MERVFTKTTEGKGPSGPPAPVSLRVVEGPDRGARYELIQGTALIGSAVGCDLRLTDPTVSRQHLRLELRSQGLHAVDLGSRNGTFLQGARIREAVILPGVRLKLGETELSVDPLGQEGVEPGTRTEFHGVLGQSVALRELIATLERVAPTEATVLLDGETGTGKEVAARALHAGSGRKGPLVVFDCSAASAGVIASELFGHVKGAFTDARTDRAGAAEQADGGTLFLDEVGELDASLQPSLLRLLEAREVRPVGGNKARKVDIRVIAATHRDLHAEVDAGRFRQDLLFRLAVVTIHLPPLRDRLEDLPLLARRLLAEAGVRLELDEAMLATLRTYAWPGNVRELRNALLRTAALGGSPRLGAGASPPSNPSASGPRRMPESISKPEADSLPADYRQARDEVMARFERDYLQHLLAKHNHNVSQAARDAGIGRAHLYRLLNRHKLPTDA